MAPKYFYPQLSIACSKGDVQDPPLQNAFIFMQFHPNTLHCKLILICDLPHPSGNSLIHHCSSVLVSNLFYDIHIFLRTFSPFSIDNDYGSQLSIQECSTFFFMSGQRALLLGRKALILMHCYKLCSHALNAATDSSTDMSILTFLIDLLA